MLRSMDDQSRDRRPRVHRRSCTSVCACLLSVLLVCATGAVAVEPCQPFEGGRVDAKLLEIMRGAAREGRLYRVVPGNSRVGFCVRHFLGQEFRGEFTNIVGGLALPSPNSLQYGQALLLIHTTPLNVSNESLAPLVKGHEFMDIRHYPDILFAGHTFEWLGPKQGFMYGDLTLRGRTQAVVFKVSIDATEPGTGELPGRIFLQGTGQVNRYRFDMRSHSLTVSETVRLCLAVEMVPWGS